MPTFSENDTKLELDGHRYVALPSLVQGSCTGCAFKSGFGCILAEAIYRKDPTLSLGVPRCEAERRKDGVDIVWVPAHTVKEKS